MSSADTICKTFCFGSIYPIACLSAKCPSSVLLRTMSRTREEDTRTARVRTGNYAPRHIQRRISKVGNAKNQGQVRSALSTYWGMISPLWGVTVPTGT